MAIKASDVSKLRQMTGAGMMDCKNALTEADGNFDKAVEIIRKKGQLVASKRADKEASEGCVLSGTKGNFAAVVALKCETDFVAKNDNFVAFTQSILDAALENKPADVEALKAIELNGSTIGDQIVEQIGIIGEKLELDYYDTVEAETVVSYIHPGNKLATIVGLNIGGTDEQVAKDVAMQVAAMAPIAVNRDGVDQATIEKELEIGREKAREEGKPEQILDKIAEGRLNKFFQESTLLEQAFIKESKMSVKAYLQSVNKDLTVTDFKRYTLNV
ncbi:translation elongation factor Ts [Saccharicrinis sp. FJH54]|uniref:translation elongation factor Ts n=1 Tax=Saccharicrinis sp. FJH54 TaxID=3344665 RepID=UPI0035D52504